MSVFNTIEINSEDEMLMDWEKERKRSCSEGNHERVAWIRAEKFRDAIEV